MKNNILDKICNGHFKEAERMIKANPKLNYTIAVGLLVREGQIELIKLIIDEWHCKVQNFDYLIEIAAVTGQLEIIKYLHLKGANIKNCFPNIWFICLRQYWDILEYLEVNGACMSELKDNDKHSYEFWKASQNKFR